MTFRALPNSVAKNLIDIVICFSPKRDQMDKRRAFPAWAVVRTALNRRVSKLAARPHDWGLATMHEARTNRDASFTSRPASLKLDGPKKACLTSGIAVLLILAILGTAGRSSAQITGQIGLPVIFVHGICDTPDSFVPAERDLMAYLGNRYPTFYPSIDFVVFYNGVFVGVQTPQGELPKGSPNPVYRTTESDPAARFFLVALDDPLQSSYEAFDPNVVANIPIYTKGNELAQIIWQVKALTGAPRVIVVTHSMGGLDTRAYIEGLASPTGSTDAAIPYFNDIAALVTLDTPHGGVASAELNGYETWFDACSDNPSINKSEMIPSGIDSSSGTNVQSVIPELNYYGGNAKPLPPGLTITSIASSWNVITPLFIPLAGLGSDNVVASQAQDLGTNLFDQTTDSQSTLHSVSNSFGPTGFLIGPFRNFCGIAAPLHLLTCTGSANQTFPLIEAAVLPNAVATSGQIQISPATLTTSPGTSVSFTATTGSSTIWSILEGATAGSITSDGTYKAPANHTASTQTYHIVAISSQNTSQYAVVPVQVTSSSAKTPTTVVLTPSTTQIPIGANVTINATVQASGGMPTGTVTFYDNGKPLNTGIVNNSGVAAYSTASLSLGFHSITATYGGDNNYATSTTLSAITIAVVAIDPQLSVSPSSGVLGVTVFAKTDNGFTPGGIIIHTATLPDKSVSVLQTNADQNGRDYYTRVYSALPGTYSQIDTDGTTGQSSPSATWTVSPVVTNDFTLSASPSSQSVIQGSSVNYSVMTTTTSGTAQNIAFNAPNLPFGLIAVFNPTTVTSGTQTTLTVSAGSSAPTGTYSITVNGTGTGATRAYPVSVTVVQAATGPVASVSPTTVPFSSQPVGSVSAFKPVQIMNTGGSPLNISMIVWVTGGDYPCIEPLPNPPISLAPFQTYDVQVAFQPVTTGSRPGQMVIFDNAPDSPQIVTLTGTGTPALPTVGTINVNATLDGIPLPSGITGYDFSLSGPTTVTGYGTGTYSVLPGSYTVAFSGVPNYMTLSSVTPSATQSVAEGGTTSFTLNFTAPNNFNLPEFAPETPQVIKAGETATYNVDIWYGVGNAATPITLTVSGAPLNSTQLFNPQPSFGSSLLTVGTSASATLPGVYTLSLFGTNTSGLTQGNNTSTLAVTDPPAQPVQLVSVSPSGAHASTFSSVTPSATSADGRYTVFSTAAWTVPGATNDPPAEVYLRDLTSGTTTSESVSSAGVLADGWSASASISADGQFVAFTSVADNLYPGSVMNVNGPGMYVRDLQAGVTEREDIASDGTPGNGYSDNTIPMLSADGRFVTFESNATNLVPGVTGAQVYERDRKTGKTILVSAADDGTPANALADFCAVSGDGRFVAFNSSATNLVSQSTNATTQTYLRDVLTGTTVLVSAANDGTPADSSVSLGDDFGPPAISADGRFIVFTSAATNLTPVLNGNIFAITHMYRRDIVGQQTDLFDLDSFGTPLGSGSAYTNPSLSADGRLVSFLGFQQVLIRDSVSNQVAVVSVASDGSPGSATTNVCCSATAVSPGGGAIAFATPASNLVANDTNGVPDVFIAQNPLLYGSFLQSLALSSPTAAGGSTVTGTVVLSSPAPAGGAAVSLWSNNAAAQPPAVVVVPAGVTSAPVTFNTSLVPSETIMTIIASYNGGSSVAVLTLEPAAELTVSPPTWDFGYQTVNTTSSIESFALTNSGTAALAIGSVQFATGQNFKIGANTCGSSLVAGGSCSVSVTFNPIAAGSASDAVQVSYGSPAVVQSIMVTGNGAIPSANLSPSAIPFGDVTVGGSTTAIATLSNNGNAALSGISISTTGPNSGEFSILSDGCTNVVLPASSSCLVAVSFAPQGGGTRQATLSVGDNAAGSPQTAGLTGTGIPKPTLIVPYLEVEGGAWQNVASVAVNVGDRVNLGPQPASGGTWSWTGPSGFTSTSRVLNAIALTSPSNVYTATYTNAGGGISTQAFTITINPTALTPYIEVNGGAWQQGVSSAAVNVSDRVNLAPTNISGGSWSWSGPSGFIASTREIDAVPLPSSSNIYTVTYTNTSGVNSTQSFTVTINPTALTPYIEVNGGAWQQVSTKAANLGDRVNLAPTNISGGSWSWSGPSGFTASTREIDAVPLPLPSNVYTVTYTNTSGVNSTQSFTVTVNPTALTPYIEVNGGAWQQGVSSIAVNVGDRVNLAPLNISGGSWSWTGPSGFIASTREIDAVPLPSSSNVYTVTYTNTSGVNSTQAFTVTVNPTALTPYIEVNGGAWQQGVSSAAVSVGGTVNLAPTNISGGSWSWSGPSGFTASTREIDAVPIPLPSNVYTVTYTNTSGVNSTQSFTVTVNPTALTPWMQVNGGAWQQGVSSAAVSVGGTVNLAPTNFSGGSWSWTGPNGFTSTSREIDAVPIPLPSNVYTVTYTNTSGVNSTQAFTVTVNSTPVVPWIQVNGGAWQQTSTKTVNVGDTVNLAGQQVSGTWSWTGPNGFTSTSREIDAVPIPLPSNVYTVTYTNTSGVNSTQSFTVTVNATAVVPWIEVNTGAWQQTASATVSTGATVNLAGQQVSGTWSWTGPSGFTSTSREIDAVPLTTGTNVYTLRYTNVDGVQSSGQAFTITVN